MNLMKKTKNTIKEKAKKIAFNMLKPFLPFIIIIIGIIFAISIVADTIFTTEDDMEILSQIYSDNYEAQYAQWLQEKNTDATIITDGKGLIPTGMFIWPIPGYTTITSHFGMRTHPITGTYKLHSRN